MHRYDEIYLIGAKNNKKKSYLCVCLTAALGRTLSDIVRLSKERMSSHLSKCINSSLLVIILILMVIAVLFSVTKISVCTSVLIMCPPEGYKGHF